MSIKKWLLFLIYAAGVCVACTQEDVVQREKGEVTIVPLWEYYTGSIYPAAVKYYFYNINNHSEYPLVVEEPSGKGVITQVLPAGTYRLVGYNTNISKEIILDTAKHLTVVAKFQSYPYPEHYVPLNICIISSDDEDIVIKDKDKITKEIIPVELKTKVLELNFRPANDIDVSKIRGRLDGVFASINLANGKAFADESDILFDVIKPNTQVEFQISDIYSLLKEKCMLSLTLEIDEIDEDGGKNRVIKTGEIDLNDIIKEIQGNGIPNDNIVIYIDISNYPNFGEKVKLDGTWKF
jgi:hypothetical protein